MSITQIKKKVKNPQWWSDLLKKKFLMSWVFKFNIEDAGYDELKIICDNLLTYNNFYHLMIRSVSENNLWIQFLYYKEYFWEKEPISFAEIKVKFAEFGVVPYVWDITSKTLHPEEKISDMVFVHRTLPL